MPTLQDIMGDPFRDDQEECEKRLQAALTAEFKRGKSLRRHRYEDILKKNRETLELLKEKMPGCPCNECRCMDWPGLINSALKEIDEILKDGVRPGFFDNMIVCSGEPNG